MGNESIQEIKFKEPKNANLKIEEEYIEICGIKIEYYHEQDCCENVYADFSVLNYYKEQIKEFPGIKMIEIKKVKDQGFIIFLTSSERGSEDLGKRLGILINCYNEQNGYYSDTLKIRIHINNEVFEFDSEKYDNIDLSY